MFRNVCRLCPSTENLQWVFNRTNNLPEKVYSITGIQICNSDSMTQMVCTTCEQTIIKFNEFKISTTQHDAELKKLCAEYEASLARTPKRDKIQILSVTTQKPVKEESVISTAVQVHQSSCCSPSFGSGRHSPISLISCDENRDEVENEDIEDVPVKIPATLKNCNSNQKKIQPIISPKPRISEVSKLPESQINTSKVIPPATLNNFNSNVIHHSVKELLVNYPKIILPKECLKCNIFPNLELKHVDVANYLGNQTQNYGIDSLPRPVLKRKRSSSHYVKTTPEKTLIQSSMASWISLDKVGDSSEAVSNKVHKKRGRPRVRPDLTVKDQTSTPCSVAKQPLNSERNRPPSVAKQPIKPERTRPPSVAKQPLKLERTRPPTVAKQPLKPERNRPPSVAKQPLKPARNRRPSVAKKIVSPEIANLSNGQIEKGVANLTTKVDNAQQLTADFTDVNSPETALDFGFNSRSILEESTEIPDVLDSLAAFFSTGFMIKKGEDKKIVNTPDQTPSSGGSTADGVNDNEEEEESNSPDLSLVSFKTTKALFICKICDSQHISAKGLNIHEKKAHLTCTLCKKKFKNFRMREDHLKQPCKMSTLNSNICTTNNSMSTTNSNRDTVTDSRHNKAKIKTSSLPNATIKDSVTMNCDNGFEAKKEATTDNMESVVDVKSETDSEQKTILPVITALAPIEIIEIQDNASDWINSHNLFQAITEPNLIKPKIVFKGLMTELRKYGSIQLDITIGNKLDVEYEQKEKQKVNRPFQNLWYDVEPIQLYSPSTPIYDVEDLANMISTHDIGS